MPGRFDGLTIRTSKLVTQLVVWGGHLGLFSFVVPMVLSTGNSTDAVPKYLTVKACAQGLYVKSVG